MSFQDHNYVYHVYTPFQVVITTFKDALIEAQQLIEFELDHVEFRISNISHEKWDIKCINSAVVCPLFRLLL